MSTYHPYAAWPLVHRHARPSHVHRSRVERNLKAFIGCNHWQMLGTRQKKVSLEQIVCKHWQIGL